MAQPVTNPKIEELRGRLKADAKSRIFYPLAEELRKVSQFTEAEQVLRTGLANHPTYLSAWVSLGRVLRELGQNEEAVESLTKALQLDPGNVVAARILADAYLALGEKVEAIKKYKLVHALLPADEELEAVIERLENELHPPAPAPVEPVAIPEAAPEQPPVLDETPWTEEQTTGDEVPMTATHDESPFEEPAAEAGYSADAFSIEEPVAMHAEPAPVSAELPGEVAIAEPAEVFAPADDPEPLVFPVEPAPSAADDFAKTITMADLYAKQGLIDEARDIYEDILARDPNNESVRAKLDAMTGGRAAMTPPPPETNKIARLEGWLAKMTRRDLGGV